MESVGKYIVRMNPDFELLAGILRRGTDDPLTPVQPQTDTQAHWQATNEPQPRSEVQTPTQGGTVTVDSLESWLKDDSIAPGPPTDMFDDVSMDVNSL